MKTYRLLFPLILLLAMLISACGGDDDDQAENDNPPENNAAVALPQRITLGDEVGGSFTLQYPENWVADNSSALLIGSTQSALDKARNTTPRLESGEVFFQSIPQIRAMFENNGIAFNTTAVINVFRQQQAALAAATPDPNATAEPAVVVAASEAITIDGKEGTKAAFTVSDGQTEGEFYALQFSEDIIIVLIGVARSGEWGNYAATAEAVLASAEIQMGTANQTATPAP